MHVRKLFLIVAVIPFAFGLNLQTGQNYLSFNVPDQARATYLGLALELLAFGLITLSRVKPARMLIAVVFVIQAPLVIIWGVIVGMFTGAGDGFSRGASLSDILPWFLNGLIYASLGIHTIITITKAARKAKRISQSEQAAPCNTH